MSNKGSIRWIGPAVMKPAMPQMTIGSRVDRAHSARYVDWIGRAGMKQAMPRMIMGSRVDRAHSARYVDCQRFFILPAWG